MLGGLQGRRKQGACFTPQPSGFTDVRAQVSAVWKVLDVVAVVAVASWVRGRRQIDGFGVVTKLIADGGGRGGGGG